MFRQGDPTIGDTAQLYDLNANAYESLMIGAFAIFYGPQNPICAKTGSPKIIDIQIAFSRDGFHWDRNNRTPFIKSSREEGTWNYGYLHASGGICLIVQTNYGSISQPFLEKALLCQKENRKFPSGQFNVFRR
ncbi:MAG: hypothetical protein CM1200mP38_6180 [Dehalococcoidia bacterium]|nr:MAG: hypothetical protein CM1200mP38_6180 [Dehalococcoidia bacterium]